MGTARPPARAHPDQDGRGSGVRSRWPAWAIERAPWPAPVEPSTSPSTKSPSSSAARPTRQTPRRGSTPSPPAPPRSPGPHRAAAVAQIDLQPRHRQASGGPSGRIRSSLERRPRGTTAREAIPMCSSAGRRPAALPRRLAAPHSTHHFGRPARTCPLARSRSSGDASKCPYKHVYKDIKCPHAHILWDRFVAKALPKERSPVLSGPLKQHECPSQKRPNSQGLQPEGGFGGSPCEGRGQSDIDPDMSL